MKQESQKSPRQDSEKLNTANWAGCCCHLLLLFGFSYRLGFASVILLLDVPQLPAILAANVCRAFRTAANELKNITARDIIYPNNRSK